LARVTRKTFLGFGAGVVTGGLAGTGAAGAQVPAARPAAVDADLLVLGARVYTQDPSLPRAEAFAVRGDRILAVGSTADIRNLAGARTTVFDARGLTITPGFIDAHTHASGVNELFNVVADLPSIAAIQQALRVKADATPPGQWVEGHRFDDTKLAEGRPLTRADLDAVSRVHPVAVHHRGMHTSWYNSKAFELAGITRTTADPSHGRVVRGADGEPAGMVAELARSAFAAVGIREALTAEQQRERARAGLKRMSELLTAAGITSIHDAGTNPERLRAYQDVRNHGELRHRAYLMVRGPEIFNGLKAAGAYTGLGDEWVRVGGVKFSVDGSASERTMRMSTPFVGTDDHGILTMTQAEVNDAVEDAHRHRFQVGIHANGDVAIDMVLQAYERVLAKWPHPDRRHRIEHCSLVTPDLIGRIKAAGVVPTPFWTYVYYHGEKWAQYGEQKMRSMFAHRSFLDAGIVVAGASDYTPGPFEPLMALQSMVTRKDYRGRVWGENQRITVDEALRIATINGAYASFEEQDKGSLTAGKFADFVALARDPHDTPADALKDIKVVRTVVGGRTMYEA
jgi:predicted amidohydrolase YtcJ